VESGEVITLNYNMQPNDVLELDHDLHTVTLNGNTNRADIADGSSAWWAMQPGNNTIHYRTDGPGAGSSAEIKWRDAWL
jgi:phage-related protein